MPEAPPTSPPPRPRGAAAAPLLQRNFPAAGAEALTGRPLAPPATSRAAGPPRDAWLRLTLYCSLLGAVLTILYAWVLARQDALAALDASGLASYHQILVPLLAVGALAGVLILERAPTLGVLLMLLGTLLGLAGGAVWLLPGTFLACVWAARHDLPARLTLGFLLLLPGIAAGYYGLLGGLSFASQVPVADFLNALGAPLSLAQALAPLELLPLALLGAWLLVDRPRPHA